MLIDPCTGQARLKILLKKGRARPKLQQAGL